MMQEFFNEIHALTGWALLGLAGGPNGENGGEIDILR